MTIFRAPAELSQRVIKDVMLQSPREQGTSKLLF
jgi:hypothetical protein